MGKKIEFKTENVSLGEACSIIKNGGLDDPSIPLRTKVIAIDLVAEMETHNSITKNELVNAIRWIFRNFDFV